MPEPTAATPQVFALPDVGEGLVEAEIVAWHVKAGDTVDVNDTLLEVETAKSVVELPCPYAGVVLELHANEGEVLAVGSPLISIGAIDAEIPALDVPREELASVATNHVVPEEPVEPSSAVEPDLITSDGRDQALVLVGTGPTESRTRRIRLRPLGAGASFERPRAASTRAEQETATQGEDRRIPVRGVRKATAEAMVRSAFSAPHATMWTTVDVTATMSLVRRLRAEKAWSDCRISPLLLIAKALSSTVRSYPDINATWDESTKEIVVHRALNLGIAAATSRGLLVPNIKGADALSLRELAEQLDSLVARARSGKLAPADMSGGTLTITNVGSFGVEGATPILNPPESAILAVGTVQERPWVVDGELAVRDVMTLSISIDHRVVDGELGANVLHHLAELLNDPALALA